MTGRLVCFGLFLTLLATDALAGAWTQQKGHYYNRLALNRYRADEQFNYYGDREKFLVHGEFVDQNVSDYLEYGLTGRFTAVLSSNWKWLRNENDARVFESSGLGDIDFAIRSGIVQGSFGVTSVQTLVKFATGYDTKVAVPLGNGEPECETRLLYGRSLWPLIPGYCGAEVGYRWRDGNLANELRFLAELGSDLGFQCYARAKFDAIRAPKNERIVDESGNPTVRASADLGTLDVTAGRRLGSRLAIELGLASGLYGRNIPKGQTWTLALACAGAMRGGK